MEDDSLLHSCVGDDEDDFDGPEMIREEVMNELMNNGDLGKMCDEDFDGKEASVEDVSQGFQKILSSGSAVKENLGELHQNQNGRQLRVSFANVAAREITTVNDKYFGSYGSFGIHREMISDKVLYN